MPAPSGTASLILGAVALAAAIYLYVLVQKMQKEVQSAQADVRTIAAHLEEEVHPAVDTLRHQQGEMRSVLASTRREMAAGPQFVAAPLCPQEDEIAQAMLRSMLGVSMREPDLGGSGSIEEIESAESVESGVEEEDEDGFGSEEEEDDGGEAPGAP